MFGNYNQTQHSHIHIAIIIHNSFMHIKILNHCNALNGAFQQIFN